MFKKYLLSSAVFSPADQSGGADDQTPEDERLEVDPTDDETVEDPVDEEAAGEGDLEDEPADGDDLEDEPADDGAIAAAGGTGGTGGRPARAERRIQALSERTRQLADENARITRQLEEARRNPPQPIETPAQRAERLSLMSPEERAQDYVTSALAVHEQKTNALTAQLMDQSDKLAFDTQATVNPLFKKLAPEVERRLADLRSRGQNLPRNVVATYLVGERAIAHAGKGKSKAQERTRQQQARPTNSRSDAVSDRRQRQNGGVAAMERRLENVPI